MNYTKMLHGAAVIGFLLFFDASVGTAQGRSGMKVSFIAGAVKVNREGRVFKAATGDPVYENDVISVPERAVVKLERAGERFAVEIRGPRLFRFSAAAIGAVNERAGLLSTLLGKVSKKTEGYYPRTIVTAVRKGGDDESAGNLDREAVASMASLVRSLGKGDYEKAKAELGKLESMGVSNFRKSGQMLMEYCRAEILFHEMNYGEALLIYLKLYKPGMASFPHRQEAHVKALVCAELLDDAGLKRRLLLEYRDVYRGEGAYRDVIESFSDMESKP